MEIKIPSKVPKVKPTIVSYRVTPKCINKSLEDKLIRVLKILLGWLLMKLSIIFKFARISQRRIKPSKIPTCVAKTET